MPMGGGGGGGGGNQKLQLGMFTLYPAFGFILPGGKVEIIVDCTAETAGRCEEVRNGGGKEWGGEGCGYLCVWLFL